jgi:hypothetical protein
MHVLATDPLTFFLIKFAEKALRAMESLDFLIL